MPAAAAIFGAAAGALIAGATAVRAQAPFLLSLPLSEQSRRRAAAVAALVFSLPPAALFGLAIWAGCRGVEKPDALVHSAAALTLFLAGSVAGVFARLWLAFRAEAPAKEKPGPRTGKTALVFARIDGATPARVGQWCWSLAPKRLVMAAGAVVAVIAALASGASLEQGRAAPAVLAGLMGGLLVFMLVLRCDPLGSPVLRATPLGFFRAWRALLRIPGSLAAAFYAGPAAAAVVAEPQALAQPIGAAFILLALCAVYAIFAAFYGRRPVLAGFSYCSALLYVAYEFERIWPSRPAGFRGFARVAVDPCARKISTWMTC